MNLAIIESGGKQYLITPKSKIQVEKLEGQVGDTIKFEKVLLLSRNNKVELGKPFVPAVLLEAKIVKQSRSKKLVIFKYKSKSRYRRKQGHRQHYTELEFEEV